MLFAETPDIAGYGAAGVIGALAGLTPLLVKFLRQWQTGSRATSADERKYLSDEARQLRDDLRKEVLELREHMAKKQEAHLACMTENATLRAQLIDAHEDYAELKSRIP